MLRVLAQVLPSALSGAYSGESYQAVSDAMPASIMSTSAIR
jgi:hypothetical protein